MSKTHPKEETYPLQRRFSTAKVLHFFDMCKRGGDFLLVLVRFPEKPEGPDKGRTKKGKRNAEGAQG